MFQNGQVSETVSDYPALITESCIPSELLDADGSYPALNGGGDIRFSSDAAGSSQLSCEIERLVIDNDPANGKATIWVKVPSLSSSADTSIWIWYNKSGESQPAEDAAYGKESVWDSNFKMVQHMNQDPSVSSPQMVDSTSSDNDGTSNGTMLTEDLVAGKVGNALIFDGNDDYIEVTDSVSLDIEVNEITISAWVKFTDTFDSTRVAEATLMKYPGKIAYRWDPDDGKLRFGTNTGGWATLDSVQTSWVAGTWYHIVVIYNGSNNFLYVNGSFDNSVASSGNLNAATANLQICANGGTEHLDATMDEVRISNIARTGGWAQTEYNNQNSPATFIIEGTPETPPEITMPIFMSFRLRQMGA